MRKTSHCVERQEIVPDTLDEHNSLCDSPQGHSSWFGLQSRNRSDPCNHGKNVFLAVTNEAVMSAPSCLALGWNSPALPSTQEDQKVPLLVAQVHSQRVLPCELGLQIMYLDNETLALEFVLLAEGREL